MDVAREPIQLRDDEHRAACGRGFGRREELRPGGVAAGLVLDELGDERPADAGHVGADGVLLRFEAVAAGVGRVCGRPVLALGADAVVGDEGLTGRLRALVSCR